MSGFGGILSGAGGANFVGGSIVRLLLDAAEFDAGLKTSEARLHGFGRRVSSVGRGMQTFGASMTRNVTLPIVAAAAVSVKMATDFEGAFTRIRANSNLTGAEIQKLRTYVLELAGRTAKSPQELAEGLYFLASAGLSASQVQQTLTMSAKASAAGLGEVGDIARLTANVLNAYAESGMTAKKATDILVAAVREGTAEPQEFAEAMGRILPIASKANVGFEEVAASLAGLSNIGLDVNEGVTAMRGLLQAMVAPTNAAKEAMADLGISSDQLRSTLAEGGLLAAMQLLEQRSGGNIDTLRQLVPNVRSLTGQLGLTGANADKVADSFGRVADASGSLDKAFRKTQKDPGFKMRQMLAELQTVAIDLGRTLMPIVLDAAEVIKDLAQSFQRLSPETREAIVKWGLLAAALGPVVGLLGSIVRLGGSAVGILAKVGGAAAGGAAGGTAGGAGGIIGGLAQGAGTAGGVGIAGASGSALAAGGLLGAAVFANKLSGDAAVAAWEKVNEVIVRFGANSEKTRVALEQLVKEGISEAKIALSDLTDSTDTEKNLDWAGLQAQHLDRLAEKYRLTGSQVQSFGRIFDKATDSTRQERRQVATLIAAFDKLGVELKESTLQQAINLAQVGDMEGAYRVLRGALEEGARKNGTFGRSAREAAGSTSVQAEKVAVLNSQVRSLPSQKTVHINVVATGVEQAVGSILAGIHTIASSILSLPSPRIPHRAAGGPVNAGGTYLVGERGPELLHMGSGGGFVSPNGTPMRIIGSLRLENGKALIDGYIDQREHASARSGRWQASVAT